MVPFDIIKKVSDAQIGNTSKLMDIISSSQTKTATATK